ncbi:MAG: hypothetical protein KDB18_04775 [Salinibacterium sp.]|nr:hypothetical protein [Salinibacterium sp.]
MKFLSQLGRGPRVIAVTAIAALALTACASGESGEPSVEPQGSDVLRIAVTTDVTSLDPALSGSADPIAIFPELAYESLIEQDPNGDFVPGLATEWGFVDDENKVFELTLREGVKFSDGGELSAQGVKDHFLYYQSAGGSFAKRIDNFASMDVIDDLHLRITLKESDPLLWFNLTPRMVTGAVISPVALQDPEKLGTSTAGAGQYVLDTEATVQGQKYVYTASPTYYDQDAINFESVEVHVIGNTSNQLNAMRANQIDYMFGTSKNADAAKADGFDVYTQPQAFLYVHFTDRDGEKVPALGDERVRQALNYAIDRAAIAKGLLGDYGRAGSQVAVPGTDGSDDSLEDFYTYDVEKAKDLLAQAGYADGFEFDLLAAELQPGIKAAAEAVASYWAAVGVTANIVVPSSMAEMVPMLMDGQVQAMMFQYGSRPMLSFAEEVFEKNSVFNPFGNVDPEIDSLMDTMATSSEDEAEVAAKALQKRILEIAWFAPIAYVDKVVISRPGLVGGEMNAAYLNPVPVNFYAEG